MADTPMYSQYKELKSKYPDSILLFRLGDFYEAFDTDARLISKILGITLTGRGKDSNRIPMAGIPHHALKQYLPKLIKNGLRVAIADQLEQATVGKLVRRDVVKVITPGTIMEENILEKYENNYLVVIHYTKSEKKWGLAYCDVSTGDFKIKEFNSTEPVITIELMQEIFKLRPAEIILSRKQFDKNRQNVSRFNTNLKDDFEFNFEKNKRLLLEQLNIRSLKSFGLENCSAGIVCAGVLYSYLLDTQKTKLSHINKIILQQDKDYVNLDQTTLSSLEIFYSLKGKEENTLFSTLNKCETAMGQRLLHEWMLRPLKNKHMIEERYDNLEELYRNDDICKDLVGYLNQIIDIDRLISRLATGAVNARDLLFLKSSINNALKIFELINNLKLKVLNKNIPDENNFKQVAGIVNLIKESIKDDPAVTITDGNIIKAGYDKELDTLNEEADFGKEYIKNLQDEERKRTGISSLKVGFNQVFGYYIEISKSNASKTPDNYIRKQTLVNAERFVTEDLKKWETIVLDAQSKASEIEYKIFEEIRNKIINKLEYIQNISKTIAKIDVYTNLALLAKKWDMVRPILSDNINDTTEFKKSRHIVVENSMNEPFIANDVLFKKGDTEFVILTGPNMSGKSTYIRQVAILFIMAQIGSFVPASYAKLVLTDRIFTRVGSADNLAGGESTFMVEMLETANILNNATEKSLVILDEIGRGTSTYDGLSIAWSIIEYIATNLKSRTLFATHYHELISLEEKIPGVKNYYVDVIEEGDEVIFMHKIVPGFTSKSYGIYVAQISGIPESVIKRANDILEDLETNKLIKISEESVNYKQQLSFIDIQSDSKLKKDINSIDINKITPLEALIKIKELQTGFKK